MDHCDEETDAVESPADLLPKKTNIYALRKVLSSWSVCECSVGLHFVCDTGKLLTDFDLSALFLLELEQTLDR